MIARRALILWALSLSLVHCRRAQPSPTSAAPALATDAAPSAHDASIAAARALSLDASAQVAVTESSAQHDAALDDADAARRSPVRMLATRPWSAPASAPSDAGADAQAQAMTGAARTAPAQLVLTESGPIAISTYVDEDERRHPILARRVANDGTANGPVVILGQYTGELLDIAASARGSTLWALWRADAEMESLDRDAKNIAVSAQLDLQRVSLPIMVAQRVRREGNAPLPLIAIEAREDGGAWAYLGLGTRPAADVDPILRTSEDQVFNEFISQGVEIDPAHRTTVVARGVDLLEDSRCVDTRLRALFFRVQSPREFVFGDYVVECGVIFNRGPMIVSDRTVQWQRPEPRLPSTSAATVIVSDNRPYTIRNERREFTVREHRFELDVSDAGGPSEHGPDATRHQQPSVRCEGGELFLTASAPALRLALTGAGTSVDLATLLGDVLGLVRGEAHLRPRTMQWTGTHLLYATTSADFFRPTLRRWRCDQGALVED